MIYILGSISSGKSSLTRILSDFLGSQPYYEDVNNGLIKGMLDKFYGKGTQEQKQVSAMLQVAFLTVRYQSLKKALPQHNAVLDSNIESDRVMANRIYQNGQMDTESFNVYMTLAQEMQSNVNGSPWNGFPDLAIYLDISPEKEIEEIQARGREMESIEKDPSLIAYYNSVNKAYDEWYQGYLSAPSIRIDRDKFDFVNDLEDRKTVLNMIADKLYELGKLDEHEYNKLMRDLPKLELTNIVNGTEVQQ